MLTKLMHSIGVLLMPLFFISSLNAQIDSFDLVTFKPPIGWEQQTFQDVRNYYTVNQKNKEWCKISIFKSATATSTLKQNFELSWQQLVKQNLHVNNEPEMQKPIKEQEWEAISGYAPFNEGELNGVALLVNATRKNTMVNILVMFNSTVYASLIDDFLSSVQFKQLVSDSTLLIQNNNQWVQIETPVANSKFTFNTTNFDDGWTAIEKEDWVEVSKNNYKVLLHYPKEGTIFPADTDPLVRTAWNILVAPRYSNLTNFRTTYINTFNRPYIGFGNAVSNVTKQQVFLVLFKRSAGWIEVITPTKADFVSTFHFDPESIQWDSNADVLQTLDNMSGRNKFAVAAADLFGTGKWTDRFTSNTYYTNIYTGQSAGMQTYASTQWFNFDGSNHYEWQLIATNSFGGRTGVLQSKSNGVFQSVNNWQIRFSDISGKPKVYDVYFTAQKGKRVLWMNDAQYPGSGVFTGFSK